MYRLQLFGREAMWKERVLSWNAGRVWMHGPSTEREFPEPGIGPLLLSTKLC